MNAFQTVDDYLSTVYDTRLEDVLCDGCLIGRPDIRLGDKAKILPRLLRAEREDDGGEYRAYDGVLFQTFDGEALFLGPTLQINFTPKVLLAAAFSAQVAGHAVDDSRALDQQANRVRHLIE